MWNDDFPYSNLYNHWTRSRRKLSGGQKLLDRLDESQYSNSRERRRLWKSWIFTKGIFLLSGEYDSRYTVPPCRCSRPSPKILMRSWKRPQIRVPNTAQVLEIKSYHKLPTKTNSFRRLLLFILTIFNADLFQGIQEITCPLIDIRFVIPNSGNFLTLVNSVVNRAK